jgi:16S rRNA processing protein RimM
VTAPARPRVEIGVIAKAHGLTGEVVVAGARLTPDEVRALRTVVARAKDGAERTLTIAAVRPFLHQLLVRFEGVFDRDQASTLGGQVLFVEADRLPRPEEGTVYLFQLVGLRVVTGLGEALGRVVDVWSTGAAPVLVVHEAAEPGVKPRERLLPMSPDVLIGVDLEDGTIEVRLMPGMEDL